MYIYIYSLLPLRTQILRICHKRFVVKPRRGGGYKGATQAQFEWGEMESVAMEWPRYALSYYPSQGSWRADRSSPHREGQLGIPEGAYQPTQRGSIGNIIGSTSKQAHLE